MSSKETKDITLGEWFAELERLSPPQASKGYSTDELIERIGKSRKIVRAQLRSLIKSGKWVMLGHRQGTMINGTPYNIPVYGPKAWLKK